MIARYMSRAFAFLFVLLIAQSASAQVTLFEGANFQGSKRTLRHADPDLSDNDFRNRAKSVIVVGGTWELCSEPGYHGDCREVPPGVYENVRDFSVASVRPLVPPSLPPPHADLPPVRAMPGMMAAPVYVSPPSFCSVPSNKGCPGCKISCIGGKQAKCTPASTMGGGDYPVICSWHAECECK